MVYYNIVFMQDDSQDVEEPLRILEEEDEEQAMEYLKKWDYGLESEINPQIISPFGTQDILYTKDNYIMSYNLSLGYIGLTRKEIK